MDLVKTNKPEATPEQMRELLHRCAMFVEHFRGEEISIAKLPMVIKKVMEFNKNTDLKQLFEDLEKYK